ncbi:UNVERIFIED_CONTAM: GDSL esterase/lipase [Sesamum latifolium]|uniref:GDSL esterase/lipase n=1 Tax=Sesamum latifolium TaxID=2727402 RepID=A0AAW2W8H3_9LAMI
MFVFGSSLVDNGNNNFLPNSIAKVDYFPYGIDFPLGPSGRFTNGRNVIDILGQKLNLPTYIPPFNDPSTKGSKIVNGVNYASGGSGILDNTGRRDQFESTIRNFEEVTLPELGMQLGERSTGILSQFLFVVGSGGNDYSLNYFLGNNNVSVEAFTANLTTTLSNQLKDLVVAIRPQMPGSNLIFVNSYKIIRDIIRFPISRGFRNASNSCCEVTKISEGGTGILCKRGGTVCANRSEYVFFDGLHPTEAVNVVIATKAFASYLKAEVYPFNVKQLSEI